MAFDNEMRGRLENIIEVYVRQIPYLIADFRNESKELGISHAEEFVYGFVISGTLTRFEMEFESARGRGLSDEEDSNVHRIVKSRIPLLKDAMLKAG
jgi:hypothetical protein